MKNKIKSILTHNQKKKVIFLNRDLDGQKVDLIITLRYDDECSNGHNTFSITANIYEAGKRSNSACIMCGCCHDEIKRLAPEYAKYIKWHLMSSDGPSHYIANTIYHASKVEKYNYYVYLREKVKYPNIEIEKRPDSLNKEPNLEYARNTAIAPDATLEQLQSEKWLKSRLPELIQQFKKAMESLGFTYYEVEE